jgi:DNA-binding GntR family transcriptional regulator
MATPTQQDTAVEATAEAIRTAIREGRFVPGQRLVVADITRSFGVSAGPAREAISRLTGEGLLEVITHRGAIVRSFSPAQIREIFQVREVVEGLAARLAASTVAQSAEAAELVHASVAELHAVLANNGVGFLEHNHAFHEMVYELARNTRVREIAASLILPVYRMRYHHLMASDYAAISGAEHGRIANALLAGDGDAAEREMRAHIGHSAEAMVAAMEARGHNVATSRR